MTCGLESRGTAPARNPVASDPLQFLGYTSYQAKSNFSKMRSKPFPPSLSLQFPSASLFPVSPSQSEQLLRDP